MVAGFVSDGYALGLGTMLAWTDDGVLSTLTADDEDPFTVSVGEDSLAGYTAGDLVVSREQVLDRHGEPVRGLGRGQLVSYDQDRVVTVEKQGPTRRTYTVYRNAG